MARQHHNPRMDQGLPSKWNTFVANRLPPSHWHHVPTKLNPADVASRGSTADELIKDSLWWHGPEVFHPSTETKRTRYMWYRPQSRAWSMKGSPTSSVAYHSSLHYSICQATEIENSNDDGTLRPRICRCQATDSTRSSNTVLYETDRSVVASKVPTQQS